MQNRLKVPRGTAAETKIFGHADEQTTRFFRKCTNLKQPYCFIKAHRSIKMSLN